MISPIDSRYKNRLGYLYDTLSQENYIKKCIIAEVLWMQFMFSGEKPFKFSKKFGKKDTELLLSELNKIHTFLVNGSDATSWLERIKEIESKTKHDIKSVEYFLKDLLRSRGCHPGMIEYVHFSLTSQDIVNLALRLQIKEFNSKFAILYGSLRRGIEHKAISSNSYMMGKTHGQNAVPMRVGDFFHSYVARLEEEDARMAACVDAIKFGGAINNGFSLELLNVSTTKSGKSFPIYQSFLYNIGLSRMSVTSQIDHHIANRQNLESYKSISLILLDLSQNIWMYISEGKFSLKIDKDQVGSSTMPSKINPINFENAEGNFKMFSQMVDGFINNFPLSRYQRDLSDSTIMRQMCYCLSLLVLGVDSLLRGLEELDTTKVKCKELEDYSYFSEYLQLYLKTTGLCDSYEVVKGFFRNGETINKAQFHRILNRLKHNKVINRTQELEIRLTVENARKKLLKG